MSWPNTSTTPLVLLTSEVDDADGRGFAGAVGAEQRKEVALFHLEVDGLERFDAVFVYFGELAKTKACIGTA